MISVDDKELCVVFNDAYSDALARADKSQPGAVIVGSAVLAGVRAVKVACSPEHTP